MGQQDFVRNLTIQQRKRLVAQLMEHFEKRVCPALPAPVRERALADYRDKVMSSVGAYHDVVLDCLKAVMVDDTTVVLNEEALLMLREIRERVG